MKFSSFIRLPRSKRFNFEPRYYDPIKEEIEERTRLIRQEMEGSEEVYQPGRISFERKSQSVPNTSFLQLLIAAVLSGMVVGWLVYGNAIFHTFWLVVPVYLYFRFRRTRKVS